MAETFLPTCSKVTSQFFEENFKNSKQSGEVAVPRVDKKSRMISHSLLKTSTTNSLIYVDFYLLSQFE